MTAGMTRAVSAALRTIKNRPQDAGAVALCRRYAALIDDAAPAAKHRKALDTLRAALADSDTDAVEALERVAEALAEHTVTSDLGPKLLAALGALGLTLAGRGAGAKGGTGDKPANPLDELRQRRRVRADRAAAVDSAAP
jgi:hypothetical protein